MPRLRVSMGKFFIKNAVFGEPMKNTQIFFPWGLLFVCCSWNVSRNSLISRSLLCRENWLHAWSTTMVGWQIKGNVWVLDQLEYSLFQWFQTLKSLYFKVYFSFTWHLRFPYTDLLQFRHKCTYLLTTNLTNKQYTRQGQS